MAKTPLETLRAIFREEFDDMLQLLSQQVDRAVADPRGAADEVRRAVHTLKGAAHAAAYEELEAACHKLETRAEKLRASGAASSDDVVAAARDAITTVSRFGPIVRGGSAVPSGPVSIAFAPEAPAISVAPSVSTDTVRVDATALGRILDASEELVLEMSRGVGRTSRQLTETTTVELLRELDYVRGIAAALEARAASHGLTELRKRLDRAVGSARTLAAASEARATMEAVAWKTSSERAKLVASAARGLRQERFESLAISATQAAEAAAISAGVKVRVVREGDDVRFDRRLREPLREILLHLVRNAVAHGFESPSDRIRAGKSEEGLLRIRAEEGEGELRVIVTDDGRGIDVDAVAARAKALGIDAEPFEALFAPGLSTRKETDELAGRGVGLDVVRQRVSDLHGRITVESERGAGTTFLVSVAPDMSLTRALVARAGAYSVAIRLSSVERIVRVSRPDVRVAGGRAHVLHRGMLLPLASVSSELGAGGSTLPNVDHFTAVVTGAGERRVALIVDEISDERELAVRPLTGRVRRIPFVSGTTVLSDGTVGWMLDVRALAAVARGQAPSEESDRARAKRVLVVDDSATTRELERTLLRANGFDVDVAADGEQAWLALTSRAGDAGFDIVLSDVEMPRLDGFALLGRIRSTPRFARLPVVLVTALEDPSDKQRALDMGASAYIVKSAFDEDELLDVIAHLLLMPIRVLVINDSATARTALRVALADEPDIQIIEELSSGERAVESVERIGPDVVLMDIVMPNADGYEVTRQILRTRRVPILMVSASVTPKDVAVALDALRAGAIAVLEAPPAPNDPVYDLKRRAIIHTIRSAAALPRTKLGVGPGAGVPPAVHVEQNDATKRTYAIVGMVASLGGPPVIAEILGALRGDHPPVLLVQHIESSFVDGLVIWLKGVVKTKVVIATNGTEAERGTVYIAPAEHHIGVTRDGRIALSTEPAIGGFRPAGTYLLTTIAKAYGRRALGIILTGMGRDGAEGAQLMHETNGYVIAQDEASCAVAGMTNAARQRGAVDLSLIPSAIAAYIR